MDSVITVTMDSADGNVNASSRVREAIDKISREKNGTLEFEKGEYHFYKEGTYHGFFAPSNNKSCDKDVAFFISGADGLTINGNGSVFVFHGGVSPFIVQNSRNVTLKNFVCTTPAPLCAVFTVESVDENGFAMKTENGDEVAVDTEGGFMEFNIEDRTVSSRDRVFLLHPYGEGRCVYIACGDTTASCDSLPVPYIRSDAKRTGDTIRFTYREGGTILCPYREGDKIGISFEGNRERDVIFLDSDKDTVISEVGIKRGPSMGVIAQCCENICLEKLDITPLENELSSTTADALHFVNCFGKLRISGCRITHPIDDVCNIHGIYTSIIKAGEREVLLELMHKEQSYFNPYRPGDKIRFINNKTLDITAYATVEESDFADTEGKIIKLKIKDAQGISDTENGYFAELYEKMPDVEMTDNDFSEFPHIRISGAGKMLIENNRITNSVAAVLALDLAKYWFEAGRITELVIRNNFLSHCNKRMIASGRFIEIGVSGYRYDDAPLIHEKTVIENNRFEGIEKYAVIAGGLRELTLRNNTYGDSALPREYVLVSNKTNVITD